MESIIPNQDCTDSLIIQHKHVFEEIYIKIYLKYSVDANVLGALLRLLKSKYEINGSIENKRIS